MKRNLTVFCLGFVFFAQVLLALGGQLASDLEQYTDAVRPLQQATTNTVVQAYLAGCLDGAAQLKGLEAFDTRTSAAFDKLVADRIKWTGDLGHANRSDPVVPREKAAYDQHLLPYREAEYLALVRLQDELFERKYFRTETAKNANFVEGALNSCWSLTRADRGDPKQVLKEPTLGVSPWEAILRCEPALAFDGGAQPAILGTFGLTRAFFPALVHTDKGPSFDETFCSKTIQKAGLRIGAGIEVEHDHVKALLGAGIQVWSIGIWGLYQPNDSALMLGISMTDLSKLKKFVGWFE